MMLCFRGKGGFELWFLVVEFKDCLRGYIVVIGVCWLKERWVEKIGWIMYWILGEFGKRG